MYNTTFERLQHIMLELRQQCPWDKKQTKDTLRSLTIEETYELADAITENNWKGIKEELGDLLLHIFFYTTIAQEEEAFTMEDVIQGVCDKLVHRHPHIYSTAIVDNEEDVKKNWEALKRKEGNTTLLGGVPKTLPATVKAIRIQEKAKQVGFEWEQAQDVYDKVQEELQELQVEIKNNSKEKMENEFGDVFFSLINYARFLGIDAESSLEKTNRKFIKRFNNMEQILTQNNRTLQSYTLQEMDTVWNKIKTNE